MAANAPAKWWALAIPRALRCLITGEQACGGDGTILVGFTHGEDEHADLDVGQAPGFAVDGDLGLVGDEDSRHAVRVFDAYGVTLHSGHLAANAIPLTIAGPFRVRRPDGILRSS